jgi:hypothetical protein|tara:strand:- start:242 stop:478 length:237 start_codon:yes stop_codon:yes gene_type:complete
VIPGEPVKLTILSAFPRYNYYSQYKNLLKQTTGKLFAVETNSPIKLIRSWSLLLAGIIIFTDKQAPGLCKFLSDDVPV